MSLLLVWGCLVPLVSTARNILDNEVLPAVWQQTFLFQQYSFTGRERTGRDLSHVEERSIKKWFCQSLQRALISSHCMSTDTKLQLKKTGKKTVEKRWRDVWNSLEAVLTLKFVNCSARTSWLFRLYNVPASTYLGGPHTFANVTYVDYRGKSLSQALQHDRRNCVTWVYLSFMVGNMFCLFGKAWIRLKKLF